MIPIWFNKVLLQHLHMFIYGQSSFLKLQIDARLFALSLGVQIREMICWNQDQVSHKVGPQAQTCAIQSTSLWFQWLESTQDIHILYSLALREVIGGRRDLVIASSSHLFWSRVQSPQRCFPLPGPSAVLNCSTCRSLPDKQQSSQQLLVL